MYNTKLKVLCCNVRVDVPDDSISGNGWNDRKDLCAEVMRSHSADVICLQECQNAHHADLRLALPEYDIFGLRNTAIALSPSNAIFFNRSRLELLSAGGFWLSETPHVAGSVSWDSARPRFANYVDLREISSGREVRVWNTHLDHIGQVARENQARLVVEAAAAFGDEVPQLLTADFNSDASNPAIGIVKSGGWQDTYGSVHGPDDPGYTYHAFKGTAHVQSTPLGKIDFIFSRGPIEALSAEIIRDDSNGRYPSDHYFISAEVAF